MSLVGLDNRGQFLIYFTLRYFTELFMIVDGRNESLKFLLKFYVNYCWMDELEKWNKVLNFSYC